MMAYMDDLDFTVTTLYSELVERLRTDLDIPSNGSIVTKDIKGHTYDYHRISYMGKTMQFYLGASKGGVSKNDYKTGRNYAPCLSEAVRIRLTERWLPPLSFLTP